jgi:hypothetical protein
LEELLAKSENAVGPLGINGELPPSINSAELPATGAGSQTKPPQEPRN